VTDRFSRNVSKELPVYAACLRVILGAGAGTGAGASPENHWFCSNILTAHLLFFDFFYVL